MSDARYGLPIYMACVNKRISYRRASSLPPCTSPTPRDIPIKIGTSVGPETGLESAEFSRCRPDGRKMAIKQSDDLVNGGTLTPISSKTARVTPENFHGIR
jgi:hypothetical protein